EDEVGTQPDRFPVDRGDRPAVLEGLQYCRLYQEGGAIRPLRIGKIVDRDRGPAQGDARFVEPCRGEGLVEEELHGAVRQIRRIGALRGEAIEVRRLATAQQARAAGQGEYEDAPDEAARQASRRPCHCGLYPSRRSPSSSRAGSRSTDEMNRVSPAMKCCTSLTRLLTWVKVDCVNSCSPWGFSCSPCGSCRLGPP